MAYDVITILDATGTPRKVTVQTVETDELVQTVGIDQAGNPVGTGNPLHVQGAVLTDIKGLLGDTAAAQVWKSFNRTTTATGEAIWTPASGKRVAITHMVVSAYDTTAARMLFWFGASGDTTYSAGTDQLVLAWSCAPSSTVKPFIVLAPPKPILAATADHILRVTTDAAVDFDVSAYGYEF